MRSHVKATSAIAALCCSVFGFFAAAAAQAAPPTHPELASLSHGGYLWACGVATDPQGDLYVSEGEGKKVKVYDPNGVFLTEFEAGANTKPPCGVAVDSSGNVYVNGLSTEVVKYEPSAYPPTSGTTYSASTINGNGKLTSSGGFSLVNGVSVDPATQEVYVASLAGKEVQEFVKPAENYKLEFGGELSAELTPAATNAQIEAALKGLAQLASGTPKVANGAPNTRKRVTFEGSLANTNLPSLQLVKPSGNEVAFEMFRGSAASHVSVYEPDGTLVSDSIGASIAGASFYDVDVLGSNGNVYVTDLAHQKALVLDPAGTTVLAEIDGSDSAQGAFTGMVYPQLAVDQANGHVYVSDVKGHGVVDEFDGAGHFVSDLSHSSPSLEEPSPGPTAIAVDSSAANAGTVYVTSGVTPAESSVYAYGALSYANFLALKVSKGGSGSGTVTSAPTGISCGSACEGEFEEGAEVTLTAAPASGSTFAGWSGCDSATSNECTVTMDEAHEVTATFTTAKLKLVKTGNGTGSIASSPAGISCGATCEAPFAPGSSVTLTATPQAGSKLKAWSGCDSVSGDECTVAMGTDREVSAAFSAKPTIERLEAHPHATTATLTANVNPNGEETTYQFEYLSQSEWEAASESFTAATKVPASPHSIAAGEQAVPVTAQIASLDPQSTYRFRLVVENAVDSVEAEGSFVTYALPQVFASCPNGEYRFGAGAALPDCRAYEQATPVNKNGGNVQSQYYWTKASPSGNRISFEAVAGLPGGDGSQDFPAYFATRSAGNWSTQGMLPAGGAGHSAHIEGWTPDFAHVFSWARKFGTGEAFLSRSSADGSLTTIIPYDQQLQTIGFGGASADGSEVVVSPNIELPVAADGATPASGKRNVYVWDRATGDVRLAGVLPDGLAPVQGSALPEGYRQDVHTISADGSLFFEVNGSGQLYQRLNPTSPETSQRDSEGNCIPDPVLACTIHVSASEKDDGGGLHGHDAAGAAPARFLAASTDGSKAIFTSSEKLTSDAYTGPEPQAPAIARFGLDGGDKDLGFLPASAKAVTVQGGYIYWIDPKAEAIGRATLDGTTDVNPEFIRPPEIEMKSGAMAPANPQDLAVDSQHIYWTNSVAEEKGISFIITYKGKYAGQDVPRTTCTVVQGKNGTCAVTEEIDGGSSDNEKQTLTVASATRITLTCDGQTTSELTGQIISSVKGSGEIQTVLETACGTGNFAVSNGAGRGTIGRADIDGDPVSIESKFIEGASMPRGIAVDSGHVYWVNSNLANGENAFTNGQSFIGRADIDGDPSSVELEFIGFANGDIAVDSEHIYYSYVQGFIRRSDLNGQNLEVVAEQSGGGPLETSILDDIHTAPPLAIDGTHLYFANPDTSLIGKVDLNGSAPVTNPAQIVAEAARPEGLAVDDEHLYWSASQAVHPNPGSDIYLYSTVPDDEGHHLTDLAPDHSRTNGVEVQGLLGSSDDGAYVYFAANGVPDAGIANSPNAEGEEAEEGDCKGTPSSAPSGTCNLYLFHDGEVTFIARLDANLDGSSIGELATDSANWIVSDKELGLSLVKEKTARVSPDGKTLLFRSRQPLTGYDNEGPECATQAGSGDPTSGLCPELFRYRVGEDLICVSCNPTGAQPDGFADLVSISTNAVGAAAPARVLSRNLSADGNRVFFETRDALVAEDTNGDEGCLLDDSYFYDAPSCQDVYEWEAAGAGSCPADAGDRGCIYLLSSGKSPHPSFFADASESGDDAFVFTFSKLVRQDEDDLLDIYDAHVEGGLASQNTLPPVPCEGEACKGVAGSAPQSPPTATQSFSGPGNPQPVHKKARHRKKKRRHHAKKRGHAKRHGHRGAGTNGRTSR